jgi:hypothetical protein
MISCGCAVAPQVGSRVSTQPLADDRRCLEGAPDISCEPTVALRGLSAQQEIALPWSSQSAALRVPPLSQALMSCIQKPTTAFNAKGLDSQAVEPRFPAPISGKDIRTVAKVGRDERL